MHKMVQPRRFDIIIFDSDAQGLDTSNMFDTTNRDRDRMVDGSLPGFSLLPISLRCLLVRIIVALAPSAWCVPAGPSVRDAVLRAGGPPGTWCRRGASCAWCGPAEPPVPDAGDPLHPTWPLGPGIAQAAHQKPRPPNQNHLSEKNVISFASKRLHEFDTMIRHDDSTR